MPPAFDSTDTGLMARAIQLAWGAVCSARPNPAVGCVIARDGSVIGEGATRPWGQAHAEVVALERCNNPRGATAYVTLEPCAHRGKTGPCADALIAAGVARVVIAMRDPNPAGAGGLEALRGAGVPTEVGLLAAEAEAVNRGFCQRLRDGRPRLRLKLAASVDGRTAMASGESQWITGPAARADVQVLRGRSDAIITGIGTVLADDPALTVRDGGLNVQFQPLRVIVDSRLRTPPGANVLGQPGSVLVAHAAGSAAARAWREGVGGDVVPSPPHPASGGRKLELLALPGADGRVNLAGLLGELARRQVNDVLVECGPRLAGALVAAGLVDELVVYTAPVLLGSTARPLLDLPIGGMDGKRPLTVVDMRRIGDDVRWTYQPG